MVIWSSAHGTHLYSGIAAQECAKQFELKQFNASACQAIPAADDPEFLRPRGQEFKSIGLNLDYRALALGLREMTLLP